MADACPECGGKLGVKATKCRCGWVMPGTPKVAFPTRQQTSCSFFSCVEDAICSVFTKTGWANVCMVHYRRIDRAPRRQESVVTLEIRDVYEQSAHYRRMKSGNLPAGAIGSALPRVPGEDDGMPSSLPGDSLEAEFGSTP